MPIEALHGRFIPSGRKLVAPVRHVLHAQWRDLRTAVARGLPYPVNLDRWDSILADAAYGAMLEYVRMGGEAMARDFRAQFGRTPSIAPKMVQRVEFVNRFERVVTKAWPDEILPSLIQPSLSPLQAIFAIPKPVPANPALELWFNLFHPEVLEFVRTMSYQFARSTNASSALQANEAREAFRSQLGTSMARGEGPSTLTRRVQTIFTRPERALTIARTESSRSMHYGELLMAKQSNRIKSKHWLASENACDKCLALAAKKAVPIDQPFHVEEKPGPYQVIMVAPAHPNCKCSVRWSTV